MNKEPVELTVFTPTYNRKHTLRRAYNSLVNQTVKNFVWLIIDDGSTDGTDALVSEMQQKSEFPIEYHFKENGGRHTAVNYSYNFLHTKYVVTLDSDDELVEDAVEKILNIWHSIPAEEYDRFWCVSGREIRAETGEMVGPPYPNDINKLTGRAQRKKILRCVGEKHCSRRVDVHIQYRFPEYSDTKFVSENQVWEIINRKYDQYCVNDVFGRYFTDSTDSITNKGVHSETHYFSGLHSSVFYVNELFDEFFFNRSVRISLINVSRCALLTNTKYSSVMSEINAWYKKLIITLGYPVSLLWVIAKRKSRGVNK